MVLLRKAGSYFFLFASLSIPLSAQKRNKDIGDLRKQINGKIHHGKPDTDLSPSAGLILSQSRFKDKRRPFCLARFFML